jgi:hypothetical protein
LRPLFAFAGVAAVILIIAAVSIPNLMRSKMAVDEANEIARAREQSRASGLSGETDKPAAPAPGDSARAQAAPPATAPGKKALQGTAEFKREDSAADLDASSGLVGGAMGDRAARRLPAVTTTTGAASAPDTKEFQKLAATDELTETVDSLTANQPREAEKSAGLRDETVGRMARNRGSAPASESAAPQSGAGAFERDGFALQQKLKQAADLERRMLAYQVTLGLEVKDFDAARRKVESLVTEAGGYLQDSRTSLQHNQKQQAGFHLRVPNDNLQDVLKELRVLGKVIRENMTTEELTDQLVDLEARLRNSRAAEDRLIELLDKRTGKVREVLEVEREITRTRQQIERMEAQRQAMLGRAAMASIHLELLEEFKAEVEGAGMGFFRQIRNAAVEGYNGFTGMLLAFATFFARWGLHLVFWLLLGKLLWRFWLRGLTRTFQLNQL